MSAYFNEMDREKAAWLRELIKEGAIADGEVDERSIQSVQPGDVAGFTQCHWFAGIGAWSYALRLAGWPDNRPAWTGSCPCPSFSAAGKGQGFDDPRHLWPDWYRLIRECGPPVAFGEQVSAAIGHGWLDLVQTDLEAAHYAVGKAVLGACSVGAPHKRQRLYFVADSPTERYDRRAGEAKRWSIQPERLRDAVGVGDSMRAERGPHNSEPCRHGQAPGRDEGADWAGEPSPVSGFWRDAAWVLTRPQRVGDRPGLRAIESAPCSLDAGTASNLGYLLTESGRYAFPLIPKAKARTMRLRGYGDAINVEVAAEFIRAYMEVRDGNG